MSIALLVSLLLAPGAVAPPRPIERIVAVVDRTPITLSEVRARALPIERKAELQRDPPPDVARLHRELIEHMVEERLIAEDAQARHLEATNDEIDRAAQAMAQGGLTVEALYAGATRELGLSREAYRDEIRRQILDAKWELLTIGRVTDARARTEARARALTALRARHHVEVRP